jgi:hypothetical protein
VPGSSSTHLAALIAGLALDVGCGAACLDPLTIEDVAGTYRIGVQGGERIQLIPDGRFRQIISTPDVIYVQEGTWVLEKGPAAGVGRTYTVDLRGGLRFSTRSLEKPLEQPHVLFDVSCGPARGVERLWNAEEIELWPQGGTDHLWKEMDD